MPLPRACAPLLLFGLCAFLLTGCAASRGPTLHVLPPRPSLVEPPSDSAVLLPRSSSVAPLLDSGVVRTALGYLGTPYVLGGTTPTGFDCSGFVRYVYHLNGVELPRNVATQASMGQPVEREDIRPGDLVFFSTTGPGLTHVGIATSRDAFVHAPNSRGVVRVEPLTSPYWSQHYAGARRLGSSRPAP
ncbi:MAG: C40 family peptidase [Acidobacteria bacterium]|nr:C40 family peptidase [Acidobacteriota bacterium]